MARRCRRWRPTSKPRWSRVEAGAHFLELRARSPPRRCRQNRAREERSATAAAAEAALPAQRRARRRSASWPALAEPPREDSPAGPRAARMRGCPAPVRRNCGWARPSHRSCTRALAYKDPVPQPPLAKRVKRFLRYWMLRTAVAGIGLLPPAAAGRLGELFGGAAFRLARGERRSALELACLRKMEGSLDAWIEWPAADRQLLERAVERGRGVVLATGHVGNWELLGQCLARSKIGTLSAVAKETTDPRLTALVSAFRAEGGLHSLWRGGEGAAKSILRALRSGEILALLIDQDTNVQSVFVPFFGKLAATPRAAADLALRTSAPVVVAFCQRKKDGTYRVSIDEVSFEPTGEREADVVSLTAQLTARIEEAIRRAPAQWVWMHRRWKTQP